MRWLPALLSLSLAACSDGTAGVSPDAASPDAPSAPQPEVSAPEADADEPDPREPEVQLCSPGVTRSLCPSPTSVIQCEDGFRWVERECPEGEFCLGGRCSDAPCAPGEVMCSTPKTLSACLTDGEGGYAWTVIETCQGQCEDGLCVSVCGFDLKQNDYDTCEHYVVDLEGTPDNACHEHSWLAIPSSNADEIAVFDVGQADPSEPPVLLEGSPFPTCDDPSRILVDRTGDVIVTCRGDGKVHKHASDGSLLWDVVLPGCAAVRGAVVGPEERLFAGCTSTRDVHELDPDTGEVLDTIQTGIAVYGLAVDATGVYVTDFGSLMKLSPIGGLSVAWKVDASGYGIAADGEGTIWLAEGPGLTAYDAQDGSLIEAIAVPSPDGSPLSYCNGVAVALDGRVALGCAETGNFIAVYTPATGDLEADLKIIESPAGTDHPRGVVFDRAGHLYAVNMDTSNVTRFALLSDAPTTFDGSASLGSSALDAPYAYSGDMTGLGACLFAGTTVWEPDPIAFDAPTHWLTIEWKADEPPGTSVEVFYRLDGGPWIQLLSGMPINAWAQTLEVRAVLSSTTEDAAPTLEQLAVFYE